MDLEIEALLFEKPRSHVRRDFKATLFWERSLKQYRTVQIYTPLAQRIWLDLESDRNVVDYNELPKRIAIPMGTSVSIHQFRFAVRMKSGQVQVIDIDDELCDTVPPESERSGAESARTLQRAILNWSEAQGIEYRIVTRKSVANDELRYKNLRIMLKFLESAEGARDSISEGRVDQAVAQLGPRSISELTSALVDIDQTILIAQLARGILAGRFLAPIDKRSFDGNLVIDLATP